MINPTPELEATATDTAALLDGPRHLYESAQLDGAGRHDYYRVAIDAFYAFGEDDGWALASHIALSALLAAKFNEQLKRYEQELLDVIQPYERFLATEREKLEQLRALEAGMSIWVARVDEAPLSVDTPADLERARKILS